MVGKKIDKPNEVQRTYNIPEWQDVALEDIMKKKGGSRVSHVRQALTEYIAGILGTAYVSRKMKEAEKK